MSGGPMHPQRAMALNGGNPSGSPNMPPPISGPPPGFGHGPLAPPPGFGGAILGPPPGFGNGPPLAPPPGFGGAVLGPPPGFGNGPLGPPHGIPNSPPHGPPPFPQGPPGSKAPPFAPLNPPFHPNQFPPNQGPPHMQGPPGMMPPHGPPGAEQDMPPGGGIPPEFSPNQGPPPGFGPPGFHPSLGMHGGPPFQPPPFGGLPHGFAPPFGAPGPFGPGFPRGPPFVPHQPFPVPQHPPSSAPPAKPVVRESPQIQMIEPPQMTRSGIPLVVQNQKMAFASTPAPIPATSEVDDQPLQFKSSSSTATAAASTTSTDIDDAWTEATTEEGTVYYYNQKTLESSWDVPKGYKVKSKPKPVSWETIGDGTWKKVVLDNNQHYFFNTKTKESHWTAPEEVTAILEAEKAKKSEGEKEGEKSKEEGQESDGEGEREAKKLKTEEGGEAKEAEAGTPAQPKESEEEHQKKVEIFKEMLRECKVAPFGKWEKELPKFVSDPRYQLIVSIAERRSIFDQFSRHRKEEERKEKKAKQKQLHDGFRELMEEHNEKFNAEFTFSAFQKLVESDSRFTAMDEKDRETLFNEKLAPFRKEIEDKKKTEFEKAKKDFIDLLKENSANSSTSWSKLKSKIDRDPRYKHHLLHSEERENIFREYVDSLEEDSAKRRKRDREEASKRDREREIKELRERENRELDKMREKLKREEEEVNFRSLLKEKIKEPNMSWKEALKILDSDPRFKTHHLARDDKDRAFSAHIKSLQDIRLKDFKSLLAETTLDVSIDWKHAKDILREDKRYEKLASEREKQTAFEKHMREVRRKAREDFKEMLKETKFLWNKNIPLEGQIEQVKKVIREDRRYAVWDSDKAERNQMIKDYIEDLDVEYKEKEKTKTKLTIVDDDES